MEKYEQIDISGDVGLRVRGHSVTELFVNAAEGMGELITDTSLIDVKEEKEVALTSDGTEGLLIQWLNELIFLFDTHGFIGKIFRVDITGGQGSGGKGQGDRGRDEVKLTAKISGGLFDQGVNESRLLLKAATYHDLSIRQVGSYWEAEVIFDI
ncbi:MAG: archease [Nitrospirae bacterium]|nr:archease [Nitrospirota bacterium]